MDESQSRLATSAGAICILCASMLAASVLLLAGCGAETPDEAASTTAAKAEAAPQSDSHPIPAAVVQQNVERHRDFQKKRQAACPRRLPDRHEELRRFPAIAILEGLGYATVANDSSRGTYDKVIELTGTGRIGMMNHVSMEGDRYVITIAEREYVAGSERYNEAPGRSDRMFVEFRWRWRPLNPLGERLTLDAPYSGQKEHPGRATYTLTAGSWKLTELWLDHDNRDYTRGV